MRPNQPRRPKTTSDEKALAGCIGGVGCLAALLWLAGLALAGWSIIELVLWITHK